PADNRRGLRLSRERAPSRSIGVRRENSIAGSKWRLFLAVSGETSILMMNYIHNPLTRAGV
ncbi:MAG TPA: hypothetical protein VII15_01330, partial [Candidatus Cryosericum sp.]